MTHEQQHEMLVDILTKLVPILTCDELSLLAYHLGIQTDEFYGQQPDLLVWQPELKEAA